MMWCSDLPLLSFLGFIDPSYNFTYFGHNVVSATNKGNVMVFFLNQYAATLSPQHSSPLYKVLTQPHLEYAIPTSHPLPRRGGFGKGADSN